MTKKELLKVLSDRYVKASHEFIDAPIDTPAATKGHAEMTLLSEVLDMALTLPKDAPEPEPPKEPKKSRKLNLVRREDEDTWCFEVWVRDRDCWLCVHRSESIVSAPEAATKGRLWMAKNP